MQNERRLGITMRIVHAENYREPRDALAQDWHRFMAVALRLVWLPVPNLGPEDSRRFCERWRLDGLILSGGEDIGAAPCAMPPNWPSWIGPSHKACPCSAFAAACS